MFGVVDYRIFSPIVIHLAFWVVVPLARAVLLHC